MHTQKLLEFQADRQACAADIGPGGGTGKTQDEPAKMAAPARDGIGLAAASSDSEAIDMARRRAAARAWSPTADSVDEEGLWREPCWFTIVNLSRSTPIERLIYHLGWTVNEIPSTPDGI